MQVVPYLTFNGQCEAAFEFYAECLGGKIAAMMPHAGTPVAEHVSAEWQQKILHAHLLLGRFELMGSDAPAEMYRTPQGISVSLQITDPAEAERVFNALSAGGTINMPFGETFWAQRFGAFNDRFGIGWMINCPQTQA